SAIRRSNGIEVNWLEPDNGGSPLTFYSILRGTASGSETPMQVVGPATPQYLDTAADPNTTYYYRVTASNGFGTSGFCGEVVGSGPPVAIRPTMSCDGVDVVADAAGDAVDPAVSAPPPAGSLDT